MASPPSSKPATAETLAARNVQDLARVIVTEAGGENSTAQTAVGWALRNRMIRNGTPDVERVWRPAFQHQKHATASSLVLAKGILDGTVPDPTQGATHFYTPQAMPKKGDATSGIDVGGGLETVPGVTDADGNSKDKNGKLIENYAPSFASDSSFTLKTVAGIPERRSSFISKTGQAMSAKYVALFGLACLLVGRPAAADVDRLTGLLDGPATDASIFQASAKLRGCVSNECLAMHDIANAFRITTRRDLPNTMVRLTPQTGDLSRIANLSLNRTLLAYPDRKVVYCRILILLSQHFAQWSVGMVSIELANRIDGSGSQCTQSIVTALSHVGDGKRVIEAAHESCVSEGRPGCDRDVPH